MSIAAMMNQVINHPLPLATDYHVSSEQECIDQIGGHAQHPSYAGGVTDHLRRDGSLGQTNGLLSLPSNNVRYFPPRPAGHENHYQPGSSLSDSNSGSISTSPSSNASFSGVTQLNVHSFLQPSHQSSLSVGSYPASSQVFAQPSQYSQSYGPLSDVRTRMSSIPDNPHSGMLPPARSPGTGNPVSPSLSTTHRDNYTTASTHLQRTMVSPRSQAESFVRSSYSSMPETPRSVLAGPMSMSPPSGAPFNSATTVVPYPQHHSMATEPQSPPFGQQENLVELTCEGQPVVPNIDARVEKGFFYSTDRVWTCYRRNYFSVNCSYTLNPHVSGSRLYLNKSGKQEQVTALAMSLSAAVDNAQGKSIELVQHTPKRDKGPQLQIRKEKVSPTPPGPSRHIDGYNLGLHAAQQVPGPYLAHQADDAGQSFTHNAPQATVTQHTFERIQFKSATANNGKRRAQQQYYHLKVELWADIRSHRSERENWVLVAQRSSEQVVVRGRSPSHYHNEGPHSHSSRGGQPGAGGAGGHYMSGSGGSTNGSGFGSGGFSLLGRGTIGVGNYRMGNSYSLGPSPSTSSASSISSGHIDGLQDHDVHMDDAKVSHDGYSYDPTPIDEAGLMPSGVKMDSYYPVKEEYGGPHTLAPASWHVGGCGRVQAVDTSRGYYPHFDAY